MTALVASPPLAAIPHDLVLEPISRRPTRLPDETTEAALALSVPEAAAPAGDPIASIAVVTSNGLPFTRLCLWSVLANTDAPPFEVIVIDNGSSDGTADYLREVAARDQRVRVVLNNDNRGFAAANNQALELARGNCFVLLNNDTIVPPGWLETLCGYLDKPEHGLVGPSTNRTGNDARVDVAYRTYGEFLTAARDAATGPESASDIDTVTMFCLAMRRDVYERLGPLDETFGVGLLEDDDYSRRAVEAGLRLVCVRDVLVHHFGEASFGELVPSGEYMRLLRENQRRYAEKWGEPWQPYKRRDEQYATRVDAVRSHVLAVVPPGVTVAVVTRGDDALLDLPGRHGWHVPRDSEGTYAGHYPSDAADAIAHIEELRAAGAAYLVVPAHALWWLDFYAGLRERLELRATCVLRRPDCIVYELNRPLVTTARRHA